MFKVSKNSITFVLMALMMVGNALPLWADSAKRTTELRHGSTQRNLERSPHSLSMELTVDPVDGDICDLQAALAAATARRLAAQAKIAIANAAEAAIDALLVRLQAILNDPNMSTEEQNEAIRIIGLEREQINYDALLQNLAVDAALVVALALIELNRLLCKNAYQNQA